LWRKQREFIIRLSRRQYVLEARIEARCGPVHQAGLAFGSSGKVPRYSGLMNRSMAMVPSAVKPRSYGVNPCSMARRRSSRVDAGRPWRKISLRTGIGWRSSSLALLNCAGFIFLSSSDNPCMSPSVPRDPRAHRRRRGNPACGSSPGRRFVHWIFSTDLALASFQHSSHSSSPSRCISHPPPSARKRARSAFHLLR
jgi:hypothetical protein